MNLQLEPLHIKVTKEDCVLSFLGILWGNRQMAIGLSAVKQKYPDRYEWELRLFLYKLLKVIIIGRKYNDFIYVCQDCNNSVWQHNYYCPECGYEKDKDDVKRFHKNDLN